MSEYKSFIIPDLALDVVYKNLPKADLKTLVGMRVLSPDWSKSPGTILSHDGGNYFNIEFYGENGRPERYNIGPNKLYVYPNTLELFDKVIESLQATIKGLEDKIGFIKLRKDWMVLNNKEKFDEKEWRIESILVELDQETTDYAKAKEILTNYLEKY